MFDKFGEFDSWEEINKAAEGQKEEGDKKALAEIAIENGFDKEDAEDYFNGATDSLCTPLMAAMGKLQIEEKDLKPENIMQDWLSYIRYLCGDDPEMQLAVRKKGKSLRGCIGKLLGWSFEHQKEIDKDIIKAAGVKAKRVTLGIPGMGTAHKLIKEYYLGGKS